KNPGFTAVAVITLALGISVNATMFSLVSAFLLRRPPVHEPDRVVVISAIDPAQGFHADASTVSIPNYLAWRDGTDVFTEIAASYDYRTTSLTVGRHSETLNSAAVTLTYFGLLGVTPELGRTFQPGDDKIGQGHVVVLSHQLWEQRFGSNPQIVGSTIRLDRETYTVIGVMPAKFNLMGYIPQLWTPLVLTAADELPAARKDRNLHVFARLKPGATVQQAQAEVVTFARRAEEGFPEIEKGWGVVVRTLPDFLIYDFGVTNGLAVIMTTVGFVLLIACANVSGLLLARTAARRKELAVRSALGAGRLRLVRQLLTEGLLLALLGGGLGLVWAYWGVQVLRANMRFNPAISAVTFNLDRNVLLFATGATLMCALLFGLAPALSASRTDITTNLKEDGRAASRGRSHTRFRSVMVAFEIALAMFLLLGSGLLFHGIYFLNRQYLGFQAEHLLTARVALDKTRYPNAARQSAFLRESISRLRELPGVVQVAAVSDLPATAPGSVTLHLKDQPELVANQAPNALDVVVTPDYFQATETPLLRGRTFTDNDDATAPRVVIVNQKFVERYLNEKEPLGRQITLEVSGATSEPSQIVGVVGNVKTHSQSVRDDPQVYEPFLQRPISSFSLIIRAAGDPNILVSALRNNMAQIDAELPLAQVMSMPAVIETQKGGTPFFLRALGVFAAMALILAAIGIYGLVAYSVGQRIPEIGIRMALGANSRDVLRMVIAEGAKISVIGGLLGLTLALPLPKVFNAMFSDLHVGQPWIYVVVAITILLVAIAATYVPAHRAAHVDPMRALRQD
ncbi:MAG TPA: ABC transporter permease, partial [Candidatus Binatia bacterium]|nr:ABC transporter permease [Candidatus Binatia bacterium]